MKKMTRVPEGVKHFLSDLCDPHLLVIKALYFTILAGVVILWPQFTVHQQELGLTPYQTGICSASVSALSIVIPFFSGFVGDKIGNYKKLLSAITALVGVLALLFTAVPSAITTNTHSNNTIPDTSTANATTIPEVDPEKLRVTFWSYLAVRVSYGAMQAVSYIMFEAAVMAHTQKDGVNYGFQRAWGTLGVIISSYLSGQLVQTTGTFSVIFYVSAGLQVVTTGLVLLLGLEFKLPAQRLTHDILTQLRRAEVVLFFAAMLAAGVLFGYLETFMYRYLVSLGASTVLIGLTVTVGAPFELVMTLLTSYIVGHVGHAPLIMFGLLAHAIRLLGFSLLVDPWWVLPLEVLESLSNGIMATAAVMYCTTLFSLQSIASFRGIFAVVYFGVGQLLGALVGAEIREAFGDVITFRALAVAALASSLAYCCAFYTLRKCRSSSITMNTTTTRTCDKENRLQQSNVKNGIDNQACTVGDG